MATKIQIISTMLLCFIILALTFDEGSAKSHKKLKKSHSKKKEFGKLTQEKSAEGRCKHPSPMKMDAAWLVGFTFEAKYVPMASELAYLSMAVRFGKSLQSWNELKKMCLKVSPQVAAHGSDFTAFGKTIFMKCDVKSIGILKCGEGGENSGTAVATWTDLKDYMLSVNCQPNGQQSWLVYSTKKKVDSKTRKIIISHIKDLGFEEAKAKTASYSSC